MGEGLQQISQAPSLMHTDEPNQFKKKLDLEDGEISGLVTFLEGVKILTTSHTSFDAAN